MCGFAGLIGKDLVQEADIVHMRDTMSHRGPDGAGVWISTDGVVGMGHRRLSIIDLSPLGHQPMANEDENIWIVYNGEIYNFLELQSELKKRGHIFRSRTDTEVIIHAYEEWDLECLTRFNGMFAFALWDERSKRLFAARDRLGIKPFYYWQEQRGRFAFASQLKALMMVPGFVRQIDRESVYWYLALRRVPAPLCIIQNCATLSPGHYLFYDPMRSHLEIRQYWSAATFTESDPLCINENEIEEEFDQLIQNAVRAQLVSDVPIGAFLSGGVDSSLVVAMMAKANAEIRTFTIGFEGRFDEAPHARRVAHALGARHEEMYVSEKEMLEFAPRLPEVYDEPLADSSAIPTYWISHLTQQHVKVALSGDGGDELFGGYAKKYQNIRRWYFAWDKVKPCRRAISGVASQLPWGRMQKAMNVLSSNDAAELLQNVVGCWRFKEMDFICRNGFKFKMGQNRELQKGNFVSQLMLDDLTTYLPDELLVKVDRASMGVSLETRVPILDHQIVEFALRLPLRLKIKGTDSKILMKKTLKKYIQPELVERPKRGFGAPLDNWLRGGLKWMIEEYLDPAKIRQQGIFEEKVVNKAIKHFLRGDASHYRVWSLIVFQMWCDYYRVSL